MTGFLEGHGDRIRRHSGDLGVIEVWTYRERRRCNQCDRQRQYCQDRGSRRNSSNRFFHKSTSTSRRVKRARDALTIRRARTPSTSCLTSRREVSPFARRESGDQIRPTRQRAPPQSRSPCARAMSVSTPTFRVPRLRRADQMLNAFGRNLWARRCFEVDGCGANARCQSNRVKNMTCVAQAKSVGPSTPCGSHRAASADA